MLNKCFTENVIHKKWKQSNIIALLKPGKDSARDIYRPISLLCDTYKLYERIIIHRIASMVKKHLIKEQTGLRPGKSCISQLLNLNQNIEDGDQRGMVIGAAFVDLSAAYNTVNHRILIRRLYETTKDSNPCRVIQNVMSTRKLYAVLNNERSKWRKQMNGVFGSKLHSLQAVELSQRTQVDVQIVSNLPAPSNGSPIYRFLARPIQVRKL